MSKSRPKAKRTPARKTTQRAELERIEIGYSPVFVLEDGRIADSGHFLAERQALGVDTGQLPADRLNTLCHELTHVAAQRFHLDLPGDQEEHLAQVFGNFWAEIFLRNPQLLDWIKERVDDAVRE